MAQLRKAYTTAQVAKLLGINYNSLWSYIFYNDIKKGHCLFNYRRVITWLWTEDQIEPIRQHFIKTGLIPKTDSDSSPQDNPKQ